MDKEQNFPYIYLQIRVNFSKKMAFPAIKQENIGVLYIDDDVHNLISFKANFRRFYNIFTAESAAEGLNLLKDKDIHVIITDQRMPEVTGVEFLESIGDKHPDPMKILITGYSDIQAVIDSINKGQVYKYITKPWNEHELRMAIEDAHKVYALRKEKDQALNQLLYKVSNELKDPLAAMSALLALAKQDNYEQYSVQHYITFISERINILSLNLNNLISGINYSKISFETLIGEILISLEQTEHFNEIDFKINIEQPCDFQNSIGAVRSSLQNIISNSIKFGRYNINNHIPSITINIEVNEKEATIKVEDNGWGISEELSKSILKDVFIGNKIIKGNGLGLFLVKTELERIGGKMSIKSIEGEASEFSITIPNIQE